MKKYDNPINKKVLVSIHGILERLKYISLFVNALFLIQGILLKNWKIIGFQTSFGFVNMGYDCLKYDTTNYKSFWNQNFLMEHPVHRLDAYYLVTIGSW